LHHFEIYEKISSNFRVTNVTDRFWRLYRL